jgi:NitT/TauT family transport system ATP-binding protein
MNEGRILEVRDLTVQYKTKGALITAVYKVSFDIHKGERTVIVGKSGSGKSTTLKAVGANVERTGGDILLKGKSIVKPSIDVMNVFQDDTQLCRFKTVLRNVMFPLLVARKMSDKEASERAMEYIQKVHLEKFITSYPHQLSGGMKARVSIARAMAVEPELFLFDEPFAALDAITARELQGEMLELLERTNSSALWVTHNISEAVRMGSRILVLSAHPGQVIAELQGAPSGHDPELEKRIHELLGH